MRAPVPVFLRNWDLSGNFGCQIVATTRTPTAPTSNLTGYRRSTAYSLALPLCQDVLRMRPTVARIGVHSERNMEKWISHYCNDLIDRIGRNTLSDNRWNRSLICSPDVSIFLDRSVVKPLRWIAAYGLVGNRRNYFAKAQHCRSRKWQDCPLLKSFRLGSQLEIGWELPPKRKLGDSEHYLMSMFEALAVAVAYTGGTALKS